MSPATARIHRRNISNPPQAATSVAAAHDAKDPFRQHTAISTPSFRSLPLALSLTDAQLSSSATLLGPTSKRQRLEGATSSSLTRSHYASPASPPPSPIVSSRGRHIKLREGSIHLQRRGNSAMPAMPARAAAALPLSLSSTPALSPPPATVSPPMPPQPSEQPSSSSSSSALSPPAVDMSAFSSLVYRSWVHSWCLWQMRCEYLLGEVRRRLSKREAGRTMQNPHSHSNRKRAQDMQSEHIKVSSGRDQRADEAEAEQGKAETKAMDEAVVEEREEAHSVASPDEFSSLISRIPPLHSQLTLPVLDSLSIVASVPVPPSSPHLPLLSALASCLMLPLPGQLSTVPSSAPQKPCRVNYPLPKDGQVWRLPEQRIEVEWEDAVDRDEDEARVGSSSRSSHEKGRLLTQPADKPKQQPQTRKLEQQTAETIPTAQHTVTSGRLAGSAASRATSAARPVERVVRQLDRKSATLRREGRWMDEPTPQQLREATRLSRRQRMAERERREKVRDARQLAFPPSKRRRMEQLAGLTSANEIAVQAANELLATLTGTPL